MKMIELSDFEISLLRILQDPLPICERPFCALADILNSDEQTVIRTIQRLKDQNIIRRFRAQLNYRALGRIASLVTAHVPDEKFDNVAHAVSGLAGVSHNYCRDHYYNLWFTLQGTSLIAIDLALKDLQEEYDIEFHSLPARRLFKLDVRFNPEGPDTAVVPLLNEIVPETQEIQLSETTALVELTDYEKQIISIIQVEIPVTSCPFKQLFGDDWGKSFEMLKILHEKKILRKISAVLNYPLLGYKANVLFCAQVSPQQISQAGIELARLHIVSHCYERSTFTGWPFTLYAMCHSGSQGYIEHVISVFCKNTNIQHYQFLPTVKELKKKPVQIKI